MTKAEQNMINVLTANGKKVISWEDVLCAKTNHGAKTISVQWSRNATTGNALISAGILRRANQAQIQEYSNKFDAQTACIERHLNFYTSKKEWKIVASLAETLEFRKSARSNYQLFEFRADV